MRRIGQLIEAIAAPDNLRLAFLKTANGKLFKTDYRQFQEDLEEMPLDMGGQPCE